MNRKHTVKDTQAEFRVTASLNLLPEGTTHRVAGLPRRVTDIPLTPLCALGRHVIATHGQLLYALTPGVANPLLIADLGEGHTSYCAISGGDRAVVMTSAGEQHVIVDAADEPVCLGTLPGLPPMHLTIEAVATLSATVTATPLTDAASLRSGTLAPADAAALRTKLAGAWESIARQASALDALLMAPDAGIVAEVRKLDAAGAPVGTRGIVAVRGAGEVATSYAGVSDGRLDPFTLTAEAYRVRVEIGRQSAEAVALWGAEAGIAEVAMGAAPPVDAAWSFRVERPASADARVAILTALTSPEPDLEVPRRSLLRHPAGEALSILLTPPAAVTNPVADVPTEGFIARAGAASGDVVMWADIDGRRGDVAMATASSPLSVIRRTTLSIAPILRVEVAPRLGSVALSPGCAHFYAFTSAGVLNLSVNARRSAPAASLLDRRGVACSDAVALAPEHVVAVASGGCELMALRGGSASTLLRRPGASWRMAACEPGTGALWVADGAGAVTAFIPGLGETGIGLPFTPVAMTAAGGRLWLTAADGLYDATEHDTASRVAVEWRGELSLTGCPLRNICLVVSLEAPGGFDGSVELLGKGFAGAEGAVMYRATVEGHPRSPLVFRLDIPRRAVAEVVVRGFAAPGSRFHGVTLRTLPEQ